MKKTNFSVRISSSLDRFESLFTTHKFASVCDCPFVLPFWVRAWFSVFGKTQKPLLVEVYAKDKLLGIAPLMCNDGRATFIGSESVCDYQDVIVDHENQVLFFTLLLEHLQLHGITCLDLGALTLNSQVVRFLPAICCNLGIKHVLSSAGSLSHLVLPDSWRAYLSGLTGKNRHEVRRKMRRLKEIGEVKYRPVTAHRVVSKYLPLFLQMFRQSREDKAEFLTRAMESYFTNLAEKLAINNMMHLGMLTVNDKPIASVFCFSFKNVLYLYNNGFSLRYSHLSIGLLSKILAIRYSIANGMDEFNFLKGDESYKRHLGGQTTALQRLIVKL